MTRQPRRRKKRTLTIVSLLLVLACTGTLAYLASNWNILSGPRFPPRLAIVQPVFTAAAYNGYPDKSFYGFYKKHANASEGMIITTDLNLLNTPVNKTDWGPSKYLFKFFNSLPANKMTIRNYTTILSDIDVNNGKLFESDGSRKYDSVVLGFSEYVTLSEYQNYRRFVETGGRLFFLDACNFVVEVKYDPVANTVSLVKGHGWEFNGTAAWVGSMHRWYEENTEWIGSNYGLFQAEGYRMNGAIANTTHPLSLLIRQYFGELIFNLYRSHEENVITNPSVKVIAYWRIVGLKPDVGTVAVYEHNYGKGAVIHTGIIGSDIINNAQMQFFLQAALGIPPCEIVLPTAPEILLAKCRRTTTAYPAQTTAEQDYLRMLEPLVVILSATNLPLSSPAFGDWRSRISRLILLKVL